MLNNPNPGLLAKDEPPKWVDAQGRVWRTPTTAGRIRYKTVGTVALREYVFQADGYRCACCGERDLVKLVADHIISRKNGGSHHPLNLQTLCESCNAAKVRLVDAREGGGA